ncbi:MAG: hypothetical protein BYD32DRAFT_405135 [Podila humilis]|nr:MAG: hypothetical protein BYD32DRAFT_405135 [Podila humilis]
MDRTTPLVAQLLLLILGLITIVTSLPASAYPSPSCEPGQFIQCTFSSAKNSFMQKLDTLSTHRELTYRLYT